MSPAYPGAPAHPPPAPMPQQNPPARSGGGKGRGGVLIVLGVLLLVVSAGLVVFANARQESRLNPAWVKGMWRNVPAEKLFPATIASAPGTGVSSNGKLASWYRVGIAPTTDCERVLSKKAQEATDGDCAAAPLATYVDATGNMVLSVALVQVKDSAATGEYGPDEVFKSGLEDIVNKTPLINTYQVSGTPAAHWENGARNGASADNFMSAVGLPLKTPYVIVTAVGSVDGRLGDRLPEQWYMATRDRDPWNEAGSGFASEYATWLVKGLLTTKSEGE